MMIMTQQRRWKSPLRELNSTDGKQEERNGEHLYVMYANVPTKPTAATTNQQQHYEDVVTRTKTCLMFMIGRFELGY